MKDKRKLSFRRVLSLHLRGMKLWWRCNPQMFLSITAEALFKSAASYVTIYLSAQIIGELSAGRNPQVLLRMALTTVCAAAALSLAASLATRWKKAKRSTAFFDWKRLHCEKFLSMDFADLDEQKTHDLYAQLTQNANWNSWGLLKLWEYFESAMNGLFGILGGVALTVSLFTRPVPAGDLTLLNHPAVSLGVIALFLGLTALAPVFATKAQSYFLRQTDDVLLGNRLFNIFGGISSDRERAPDIRMYRQEAIIKHYMKVDPFFGTKSPIAKYARGPMGLWDAASAGTRGLFFGIVCLFACLKAWAGAFGVGAVAQYVAAVTQLSQGASQLLQVLGDAGNNAPFLETDYRFLDIPNKMYMGSLTTEKRADRNFQVEFRDVSFRYPGSSSWALRHVTMGFRVGSRLAVVGENGSGKTTFIKLLCRLYDPTEGQILLNGIDIRKYNYSDYRDLFSVVFQDFQLLALPLGQNVAASASYDRALAEACLDKAGFGDRLTAMPQGLDTCLYKELDKEGVDISGGEAQKIAIARALYKDAPFLILDEPTAALDPMAEAEIYEKLNEITGDKTAVYISHRLSSCKFCDEILVFQDGSIVQQGSHEALSQAPGKYRELWQAQAQYYTTQ